MSDGVLIAGGGLAAQRCCEALRSLGFEGRIRIVGDERHAPYDRPPLSKAVLSGEQRTDAIGFRDSGWYADHDVELLLGDEAVALDPGLKTLTLASGATLRYDTAVVATGSRPRPLPGTENFPNTHLLRTVDDAERLRDALPGCERLIVVGAGFIGLEVAATARRLGVDVTVLEAAPRPMARVLAPQLSQWFVELHRAEGVDLRLSAHVARFGEGAGGAEWVQLTDGGKLECDALVIGIGIEPATEWLEGSGLEPDGVRVDAVGRTGAPDVFAAGDAARVLNPLSGEYERSQQWESAARQSAQVARAILGVEPLPPALPSFWTDQYGLRVQLIGDAREADEIRFDGDPAGRQFAAEVVRGGLTVAGFAAAQPRSIARFRKLIGKPATPTERSEREIRAAS